MVQPVAPFTQPAQLVGSDGIMSEGVNKVAIYYWDTSSLAWVKATGGSVPGQNVNVTNFPAVQPVSATSWPLPTGASTEATLAALNAKVTTTAAGINVNTAANGDVIDAANSTTTPLLANASFTGAWVNTMNYAQINILAFSDQTSAAGGLQVQFSSNGINVDHTHTYLVVANVGETIQVHTHAQFYRIVYTNGTVNQTAFRMQSILRPLSASGTVVEADDVITQYDDAVLTKAILTGQNTQGTNYVNVKATPDGGIVINQNTVSDPTNSSTANLASGATFTGTGQPDLTYTGLQFQLFADQDCYVYLEQSINNINWDVSDRFISFANQGSGSTVQLVSNYYRVRVTNIGPATTTVLRLVAILVPIINPLPRTLDQNGYLQIGIKSEQDLTGNIAYLSPYGEKVSVPIYRLAGQIFSDATLDATRWTSVVGTGGTVTEANGVLTLSTGTTANNATSVQSVAIARYFAGQPNKFRVSLQLPDTGIVNNTRRGGAYTTTDGAFFELSGTTFRLVTRKGGVDIQVNNGSFNGNLGPTLALNTALHHYEIVYTTISIRFYMDDQLIHTVTPTSNWYNTIHFPIRFENFNSGGSTTNVSLSVTSAYIAKMGIPEVQPIGTFLQNAQTAVVKSGPGSLLSILCSGITNNSSVVIYDNTAGSGTVVWNSGTFGAQTTPFGFDFQKIALNVGLTLVITGTINVLIMYE